MKTIVIAVCLFSSSVFSADPWTDKDAERENVYLVIHAIDWLQTRYIARHPFEGFREANPLLHFKEPGFEHNGSQHTLHGFESENTKRANAYFLVTGIAHYYTAKALPEDYRKWFQYVTIGVETAVVGHNYNVGVRLEF